MLKWTTVVLTLLLALPANADSTNDDCSFIRDAIKNLPEAGGEVVVPAGTYTCLSPIVLNRHHVSLRGDGSPTLKLGNNINTPLVIMGGLEFAPSPIIDVEVRDLNIDGNRWNQKYECWSGLCDGQGYSYIRNNGITVRGVTNGRIQNVIIRSARSGGIVTEKGCFDLVIQDVVSVDNEFDGFAGYETTGARLNRLDLSRNRAAGISLDIRFHGNIFKNITIHENDDVGIFMRDSRSNIFENVSISESGNHGVFIAMDGDTSTCSQDNEFQNLSVYHSRGMAFVLNDVCEGNRFTGTTNFTSNRDGCLLEVQGAYMEGTGTIQCEN